MTLKDYYAMIERIYLSGNPGNNKFLWFKINKELLKI